MNPKCCSIPIKRGWSYCPECGEHIDWETKAQKLARKKEHERKMKADPVYRKRHEQMQIFLKPQWDLHFAQFIEERNPLIKMTEINKITSEAPASLEGMEG